MAMNREQLCNSQDLKSQSLRLTVKSQALLVKSKYLRLKSEWLKHNSHEMRAIATMPVDARFLERCYKRR